MKKFLPLLLLLLFPFLIKGEIYIVEAGGNSSVTPYYAPQLLTINVGDTVIWDFVLGTHNVTTTSGPVDIDSGDIQSPNEFMFIFDVAGVYEYECTLFDHADTQFGTITVNGTDNISENLLKNEFVVYPNPSRDEVFVEISENNFINHIRLIDPTGKELNHVNWDNESKTLNVSSLPAGLYVLILETSKGILKESLRIEK